MKKMYEGAAPSACTMYIEQWERDATVSDTYRRKTGFMMGF